MSPRERATLDVFRMYRTARRHQSVPVIAMRVVVETLVLAAGIADQSGYEPVSDYHLRLSIAREYLDGMWYRRRYWLQAHYPERRAQYVSAGTGRIRETGTGWPV